jgi:phosphoglycolate phosphatase-like HAD superfamily hydrolase
MLWEWLDSRKQVFILDLDGTLMPCAEIDDRCFWQAVFACFGERDQLPGLHGFKHVTDSGILNEWCQLELGRLPGAPEIASIKQDFAQRLELAHTQQPWHFKPLPGVRQWLQAIGDTDHVYTGIATGGWEHSARLKLQLSGLDDFNLPLASSDDAVQRTEIMRVAAQSVPWPADEDDIVFTYVGDGTWDLQASRALGWQFIGIADGEQAVKLEKAGADHIRKDFCKARF